MTSFYTDIYSISVPIHDRISDKESGKTKNDYCREMLIDVLAWVTGDSGYSSLENVTFIRSQHLNWMLGIDSHRIISSERGQYIQIQTFEGGSSGDIQTRVLER